MRTFVLLSLTVGAMLVTGCSRTEIKEHPAQERVIERQPTVIEHDRPTVIEHDRPSDVIIEHH